MIIVKIIGGLGNQIFQYAYAQALQERGYIVKLDISAFDTYDLHTYGLEEYNIDLEIASLDETNKIRYNLFNKILKRIGLKSKILNEKNLLYEKKFLKPVDGAYIIGYFQSEKYFVDIRDILLKKLTVEKNLSGYGKQVKDQIRDVRCIAVSLHIRRGDYLSSANTDIHGLCGLDYYKKAMSYLEKKFNNIKYFVFSDDIEWVKENLETKNTIIYVTSKEKRIPHEDIYLMSLCQHNIIANSSFSWWGAWLNQNQGKTVITPKKWFNNTAMISDDIVPLNWIKL